MPLTIQSSEGASIAQRSLLQSDRALTRAMERLASGKNTPSARYDITAATIAARLRGNMVGWQAAMQNATQVTSMLQTAEGAYQRTEGMLNRMRALAAQAQSQNLSGTERNMLDTEYQQMKSEINRLAQSTTFAGSQLFLLGSFAITTQINTAMSGAAAGQAIADFTGDGINDVLIMQSAGTGIDLLRGNGDGTFTAQNNAITGLTGASPLITADYNGDGRMDLIWGSSTSRVYLNNGNGSFTQAGTLSAGAGTAASAGGDFNGDGRADIAFAVNGGVNIFYGNGGGGFNTSQLVTTGFTGAEQRLSAADINGDGRTDIAVFNTTTDRVTNILTDSGGGFTLGAQSNVVGNNSNITSFADLNSDGFLDLLVNENNGNNSAYYMLNNGQGGWNAPVTAVMSSGGTSNGAFYANDINGDGMIDLLSMTNNNQIMYRLGTGNLAWSAAVTLSISGSPFSSGNFIIADLNRDGRLDFTSSNNSNYNVFMNTTIMGLEGSVRVGPDTDSSNQIGFRLGGLRTNSLDTELQSSVITTAGAARRAEQSISRALNQLTLFRTGVAAIVNRLEKVQDNINTIYASQENARSAYEDLDVAAEMAVLVSEKIRQQAGISMMTQAHVTQKNMLRLIQSSVG